MMQVDSQQNWAVIPATGIGRRMQVDRPKQYLDLCGQTILQRTLDRLLSHDDIHGGVLVLNIEDRFWADLNYTTDKPLLICQGGDQRQHSVFNGLQALRDHTGDSNPLVLIHDAVRPFVSRTDLSRLIDTARRCEDGALLAAPVADTIKLADRQPAVLQTQSRENLWRALTPQAFRLNRIFPALKDVIDRGLAVTDDASAMELFGYKPRLVSSSAMNFKITTPDDLLLARSIVQNEDGLNNH